MSVTTAAIESEVKGAMYAGNQSNDVKDSFKRELISKYGQVVPTVDVVKLFGKGHGLPVIDGVVSVEAISKKLVIMREVALCSAS